MTGRINAFIVILEKDIREDDVQKILLAIVQLRGVLEVQLHKANSDEAIAEVRAKNELVKKLWEVLQP